MDTGGNEAPARLLRPADVRVSDSGGSEKDVGHAPKHKITTDPSRPLKALIVEDDALIAYDLQMMLTDLDVEVVGIAMTEREAARLAALHQPDFATMDVVLRGECNGIDTAIRIYQTHGIRSLFVTGNVSPAARLRGAAGQAASLVGQADCYFTILRKLSGSSEKMILAYDGMQAKIKILGRGTHGHLRPHPKASVFNFCSHSANCTPKLRI